MMTMPSGAATRSRGTFARGLALVAGMAALQARAAFWEDRLWAVSGEMDASGGYDSNLYAINGGPGDWYSSLKPSVDLSRKDSLLSLDAEAWVDWTTFLAQTGSDATDPGFRVTLAYPANVDTWTTQSAEVHWDRTTAVDVDIGQRVSREDMLAKYEGDLADTGKTSVVGRLSLDRYEYLGAAFDTIDTASLGTSVLYSPDGLFRAGAGYDLTLGESQPNSPGPASLDQTEQAATLQAEGEFTPKVAGKVSVGIAYSEYTGGFTSSEWDLVAATEIVWKPRERLSLDLGVARSPYFNADGDVDIATSVVLGATQDLGRGFSIRASARDGLTNYVRSFTYRTDYIKGAGLVAAYNLTGRLTASAGCDWTRQNSDIPLFTYRRHVATGQLTYKF
jgi:hypothetical protein